MGGIRNVYKLENEKLGILNFLVWIFNLRNLKLKSFDIYENNKIYRMNLLNRKLGRVQEITKISLMKIMLPGDRLKTSII